MNIPSSSSFPSAPGRPILPAHVPAPCPYCARARCVDVPQLADFHNNICYDILFQWGLMPTDHFQNVNVRSIFCDIWFVSMDCPIELVARHIQDVEKNRQDVSRARWRATLAAKQGNSGVDGNLFGDDADTEPAQHQWDRGTPAAVELYSLVRQALYTHYDSILDIMGVSANAPHEMETLSSTSDKTISCAPVPGPSRGRRNKSRRAPKHLSRVSADVEGPNEGPPPTSTNAYGYGADQMYLSTYGDTHMMTGMETPHNGQEHHQPPSNSTPWNGQLSAPLDFIVREFLPEEIDRSSVNLARPTGARTTTGG